MAKFGFGQMIDRLKKDHKTIVFTEGTDARILEASSRLLASNFLKPILIGDEDEIYDCAEESGFNIRGANIISPYKFDDFDKMVVEFAKDSGIEDIIESIEFIEYNTERALPYMGDKAPLIIYRDGLGI